MLSLSNGGMSSGQAASCFAREDYYLKGGESSQWLGKTAEEVKELGRMIQRTGEEEMQEEGFRNVAEGKSRSGEVADGQLGGPPQRLDA